MFVFSFPLAECANVNRQVESVSLLKKITKCLNHIVTITGLHSTFIWLLKNKKCIALCLSTVKFSLFFNSLQPRDKAAMSGVNTEEFSL